MKDPAALIYKDKWTASTNGMKAAFRAWYFDLLIYQFNHPEGVPHDEDVIAGICRVLPSEYDLFNIFFKQVLKQKFKLTEKNLLINDVASEIIQGREKFIEKRSKSGKIGYLMKIFKAENYQSEFEYSEVIDYLMNTSEEELESMKDKQVFKQVLKQKLKLYINEDKDINKDNNLDNIKKSASKKFSIPSVEEISAYCQERKNSVDPQVFFDFYQSKGWKIGKNQMKDWKACVRTWEKNSTSNNNSNGKTEQTTTGKQPYKFSSAEAIKTFTGNT